MRRVIEKVAGEFRAAESDAVLLPECVQLGRGRQPSLQRRAGRDGVVETLIRRSRARFDADMGERLRAVGTTAMLARRGIVRPPAGKHPDRQQDGDDDAGDDHESPVHADPPLATGSAEWRRLLAPRSALAHSAADVAVITVDAVGSRGGASFRRHEVSPKLQTGERADDGR
jgi:hypothetical protein